MAVSIVTNGYGGVNSGTANTTTQSLTVPAAALAGDILLVLAVAERAEPPVLTIGGAAALATARSEASSNSNLSITVGWKRLLSADLGKAVVMTNTGVRRQALAGILVRGATDPTFSNPGFNAAVTGTSTKAGPALTPTVDSSVLIDLWGMVKPVTPYTGYSFTSSWTELVETTAQTATINPTALISARTLSTGTAGVAQQAEQLTMSTNPFDSFVTGIILRPTTMIPAVNAGADTTAQVGAGVTVTGTALANYGNITAQAWTVDSAPGSAPALSGASTATVSFTPANAGPYVLRYTVTDSNGLKNSDTVTVTAQAGTTTAAPNATVVIDGTAYQRIDATGSAPSGGGALSYAINPSTGVRAGATPGVWFAPRGSTPTDYTVSVTESGTGLTDTALATISPPSTDVFVAVKQNGQWVGVSTGSGTTTPPTDALLTESGASITS